MSLLYVVDGDKASVVSGRTREDALKKVRTYYRSHPTTKLEVTFLQPVTFHLPEGFVAAVDEKRTVSRSRLVKELLTAWLETQ